MSIYTSYRTIRAGAMEHTASVKTQQCHAPSFSDLGTITFCHCCSLILNQKSSQLHLTQIKCVPGKETFLDLAPYEWELVFTPQEATDYGVF